MTRNLNRRIELLFEVEHPPIKKRVMAVLDILFTDTMKTRILRPDGTYKSVDRRGKIKLEAQTYFSKQAMEQAKAAWKKEIDRKVGEPILSKKDL